MSVGLCFFVSFVCSVVKKRYEHEKHKLNETMRTKTRMSLDGTRNHTKIFAHDMYCQNYNF